VTVFAHLIVYKHVTIAPNQETRSARERRYRTKRTKKEMKMKLNTNVKAGPTAVEYAVMLALIIVVC